MSNCYSRFAFALLIVLLTSPLNHVQAVAPATACRIEVVDKEYGWPVPMVELRTDAFRLSS